MAKFSFIQPTDQPLGKRRLLHILESALNDDRFSDFRLVVAYARSGPLYRLQELLQVWRKSGNTSSAIFGLNHQGTSKEVLELALTLFDSVYVVLEPRVTFHPKFYLFRGKNHAEVIIGSNNLTVGGTEKNFESAVDIKFELPSDRTELDMLESSWSRLLPDSCPATTELNSAILETLLEDEIIVEEKMMNVAASGGDVASVRRALPSDLNIVPESPLPKGVFLNSRKTTRATRPTTSETQGISIQSAFSKRFVIQIKPHHNGEIFLSMSAVKQNPNFFGWPFRGKTKPKITGNPEYPQLTPSPVVNIRVFGENSQLLLTRTKFRLTTVYYKRRSEIRITAGPLVDIVPEYSVMIMEQMFGAEIDYEIIIHRPDSPEYDSWVTICDQTMPSGGQKPRKFGWF